MLPAAARRRLGLRPGVSFTCTVQSGNIVLAPKTPTPRRPRFVKSKRTGLVYAEASKGAPKITTEKVRTLLADFP